ncbi:uncharacterized protein SAPINGB_P004365 [Magnusiomyces paraingens]|uniref:RING-type domain-containing protein n=1 Tax=Magnusiomyces paraingens TaxID=2606893 RepID=A0A5E8BU37_9ASCO|nr:uncharacterized protein SAPINGB_P004365 [Saprochaete ingens]VVT54993.1 unnamed protein product [Saprochaete ingens]
MSEPMVPETFADRLYQRYYNIMFYSNKYFPLCILCWCGLLIFPYALFGLLVDFLKWQYGDPNWVYTKPLDPTEDDEERNIGYTPQDNTTATTVAPVTSEPHRNMTTMFFRAGVAMPMPRRNPEDENKKKRGDCLKESELDELFPVQTYGALKAALKREWADEKIAEEERTRENGTTHVKTPAGPPDASVRNSVLYPIPSENLALMCTICQCVIGKEEAYDGESDEEDEDYEKTHQHEKDDDDEEEEGEGEGEDDNNCGASAASDQTQTKIPHTPSPRGDDVLVRRLACHHVFHDECIREWLCDVKGSCPLCSRDYAAEVHGEEKEVDESVEENQPA